MLWGIDSFREAFFEHRPRHSCAADTTGCVFCATAQIFESLNAQTQGQPTSAEVLQIAISVLNSEFTFGEKQDANEVHEAMLEGVMRARNQPSSQIMSAQRLESKGAQR